MKNKLIVPKIDKQMLIAEFNEIKKSIYYGEKGIFVFKGKKRGPVLGITINTHGNEPSGLATSFYLRKFFKLEERIEKGAVIIVINNIDATERYFKAKNLSDKVSSRFVDVNFNRLPDNTMRSNSRSYEIIRAKALRKIWKKFDVGIDIHSTTQKTKPMIVACNGLHKSLIKGFPIATIISNIQNVQIGRSAVSFYGNNAPVIGIEAGSHEDQNSYRVAIRCVLSLITNLELISGVIPVETRKYYEYFVYNSILFPSTKWKLVRKFKPFEFVSKDQVLAKYGNDSILAKRDGHVLFCSGEKVTKISEEVVFLSLPKKQVVI